MPTAANAPCGATRSQDRSGGGSLRKIAEEKIGLDTRVKAAKALRSISAQPSRLAEEVESKSVRKRNNHKTEIPAATRKG